MIGTLVNTVSMAGLSAEELFLVQICQHHCENAIVEFVRAQSLNIHSGADATLCLANAGLHLHKTVLPELKVKFAAEIAKWAAEQDAGRSTIRPA